MNTIRHTPESVRKGRGGRRGMIETKTIFANQQKMIYKNKIFGLKSA